MTTTASGAGYPANTATLSLAIYLNQRPRPPSTYASIRPQDQTHHRTGRNGHHQPDRQCQPVELLLPLTLKWARETGRPLAEAIRLITERPAAVMGVEGGTLGLGKPADICILDPDATWTVNAKSLASLGKNSPYLGMEVQGRVRYTIIDGHLDFKS